MVKREHDSPAPPASESEATERAPDTAPVPAEGPQAASGEEAAPVAEPEEASAGADQEAQAEHDLQELAARAGKADQYLELAKRTQADFENYRKRAAREAAAAQQRGIVKLARELLPAVDDLDRAVAAVQAVPGTEQGQDGAGTLVSGIKLVHSGVIAALARVGIEPYSPVGERFDPQHHEAVAQQPVEGAEPGTVVEVYQRGYRLHDGSVLRPARVVVSA
ncbi:MAG: nucleotide exchange factor GrpE [Solirubrobacteraceae bacterium]